MSDNNILVHMVDQMYMPDWFSKDTMTIWEETKINSKTWKQCQQFFEEVDIARKRYIQVKGSAQESINKVVMEKCHLHLNAMETKAMQDRKQQEEHVQLVTQQNTTLMTMIQQKQKTSEELMTTSKSLLQEHHRPRKTMATI